jgi:hypothetical protein
MRVDGVHEVCGKRIEIIVVARGQETKNNRSAVLAADGTSIIGIMSGQDKGGPHPNRALFAHLSLPPGQMREDYQP